MSYYELFQESPTYIVLVLLVSLIVTLLVYGAFPVIFAKTRKTPITKKKYKRLCYGINIIGLVLFFAIDGAASGGPYLLWTWVFSNYGVKALKKKALLLDAPPSDEETSEQADKLENKEAAVNSDIQDSASFVVESNGLDNQSEEMSDCTSKKHSKTSKLRAIKKSHIIISAIVVLVLIASVALASVLTDILTIEKDGDYLYNWLLENGELVNGTKIVYSDNDFSLCYDTAEPYTKLFVVYSVSDYEGYQLEARVPLFGLAIESSSITLINDEGFTRGLKYSHTPSSFTNKTPIKHVDTFGDTISTADYPLEYVDGKYVMHVPEEDKPKLAELKRMNALCEELAHKSLCSILDWLSAEICPLADMEMSDFGYFDYKVE